MDKAIKKFNQKNSILVISSYPDKKKGIKDLNAVAWYSQKIIKKMAQNQSQKFVVLAEKTKKSSKFEFSQEKNVLLIRCWKNNSPLLFKDVFYWLKKFYQIETINIQFEFSMFGGLMTTILLPFFLIVIKVLRKKIVFTLHHVVADINTLSGHLNLKPNSLATKFFNHSLFFFYKLIGIFSHKIIVLDNELKKRLKKIIPQEKIAVVPIGVEEKTKTIGKREARKKLGLPQKDFILLSFGFVAWYKGTDWLVKQKFDKKTKLIIAGGESPTLKNKPHYRQFYNKVFQSAKKKDNVIVTGFLPENKIPLYFAASDLVLFPYRTKISSSGPLAWTLSYKKPFFLSTALSGYFLSEDFRESLNKAGIKKEMLLFSLKKDNSLKNKISHLNKTHLFELKKFSASLAQMQDDNQMSLRYHQELKEVFEKTTSNLKSRASVTQPAYV